MTDFQMLIDNYNDYPFFIKLAWVTSVVLSIAIILLTIYLKFLRKFLRNKEADSLKFRSEYEALLIEYLYSGGDDGEISEIQKIIIDELKTHVSSRSKRKVIISVLYKLMNEVSGEVTDAVKILYKNTGLLQYSLKRLNSKRWYIKAKGIGELTKFKIESVQDEMIEYLTHSTREVRKEAHFYFVNLFHFEGLTFLNTIKTPLSEWDQIQILEILQRFNDQEICDIKPWLQSKNDTVVLFALKLAKVYNQYEAKDILMDLLSHNNKDVRIQTIEVLTHLYGIEAKDVLKANFGELSLEEQRSFFGLLEKLVIPDDEPFVEKHLFHKDFEIQLLALKILKSINLDKYIGLNKLPSNQKSSAMLKLENAY
ncbi:hypothetical protein [Pontimicrobium sp. SW4]|uniref:HEAT repeat domain-containing protein n=1 Tax=Pontimicrobium sp. SW4 TaxID=3153519 RepID=A0AAU7BTL7_9FLAO